MANLSTPGIQQEILNRLARIRQQKAQQALNPLDYHNFMPRALDTNLPDIQTPVQANINSLHNIGDAATQTSQVMARNKMAKDAMLQQQKETALQKRLLKKTRKHQPRVTGHKIIGKPITNVKIRQQEGLSVGPGRNYRGDINFAPRFGKDNTPEVSDLKRLRPHAPIETVSIHGATFQVNKQVAPIFVAFLDDLWKHGYHFVTVGGYRPTVGYSNDNLPFSLHQLGFAIDVDASKNPYQSGSGAFHTTLPPGVAALAAKYGLEWGGSWIHNHDPMHFGIKYKGVE